MRPEYGIKERITGGDNAEDNMESEESEETEQIFFEVEQQSWREVADIIAMKGSIKGSIIRTKIK